MLLSATTILSRISLHTNLILLFSDSLRDLLVETSDESQTTCQHVRGAESFARPLAQERGQGGRGRPGEAGHVHRQAEDKTSRWVGHSHEATKLYNRTAT